MWISVPAGPSSPEVAKLVSSQIYTKILTINKPCALCPVGKLKYLRTNTHAQVVQGAKDNTRSHLLWDCAKVR